MEKQPLRFFPAWGLKRIFVQTMQRPARRVAAGRAFSPSPRPQRPCWPHTPSPKRFPGEQFVRQKAGWSGDCAISRLERATLPNRRVRTRTHGGVGGAEPRGSPMSRSNWYLVEGLMPRRKGRSRSTAAGQAAALEVPGHLCTDVEEQLVDRLLMEGQAQELPVPDAACRSSHLPLPSQRMMRLAEAAAGAEHLVEGQNDYALALFVEGFGDFGVFGAADAGVLVENEAVAGEPGRLLRGDGYEVPVLDAVGNAVNESFAADEAQTWPAQGRTQSRCKNSLRRRTRMTSWSGPR